MPKKLQKKTRNIPWNKWTYCNIHGAHVSTSIYSSSHTYIIYFSVLWSMRWTIYTSGVIYVVYFSVLWSMSRLPTALPYMVRFIDDHMKYDVFNTCVTALKMNVEERLRRRRELYRLRRNRETPQDAEERRRRNREYSRRRHARQKDTILQQRRQN